MLSPVSLRICWVAAMAPALTEAANQAENFNLPCSPGATDLEFSAALSLGVDFIEKGKHKINKFSYMTLGQLASPCKADGFESRLNKRENLTENVPALPWKNSIQDKLLCGVENLKSNYGKCSNEVTLESKVIKPHRVELSLQGLVITNPCKIYVPKRTMSKNITHLQDTMGLLNANTAAALVDNELKCKLTEDCIKQSAFSCHEQMLLFSDPQKQDRCADIDLPLEVDDEKLPTQVSEALLKKLVASSPQISTSSSSSTANKLVKNEDAAFHWTALPNVSPPESKIQSMESCYNSLRGRAAQIIKRIRKLQMKQTEGHIAEQLQVLKENRNKLLDVPPRRIQSKLATQNRLKKAEELLHSKEVKNLSTTALVDLVKEIELSHASGHFSMKDDFNELEPIQEDLKYPNGESKDPNLGQEICRTVVPLKGVLHHLQSSVVDSDVTESSSGGESGDEGQSYGVQRGKTTNLHKRSYWRWTLDRAAVATRWVWLQAQISDLEYKIRQQNEVYRQLRITKGGVTLQDSVSPKKKADFLPSNVTNVPSAAPDNKFNNGHLPSVASLNQTKGTTSNNSTTNNLHKSVNGFWSSEKSGNGIIPKIGESSPMTSAQERLCDEEFQRTVNGTCNESSRTRPLKCFKKRRLVRTMGLHFVNRRVIKLSSVRCHCNCQRDYLPCITCGGRYNSTQSVDADTMPFAERVSLLDPSFHPRLSLKHETQTGIQYENLLRRSEFQRASNRMNFGLKRKRGSIPSYSLSNQARKHSQRLAKNAAQTLLSSARIRKSLDGTTTKRKRIIREKRNSESLPKRVIVDSETDGFRRIRERQRASCSISSCGSKPPSPSISPIPPNGDSMDYSQHIFESSTGKVGGASADYRRRRLDDAYDINNIVIPYSIASATRLEKLQYKEILTPKWRLIESEKVEDEPKEEDDDLEDLSDELYTIRHLKCEEDERKKFLSYVNVQGRSRSRSTRQDSRADSSGANTPDPMSPAQSDYVLQDSSCGWNSPVASPPPPPPPTTPQTLLLPPPPPFITPHQQHHPHPNNLDEPIFLGGTPAPISMRRRTISLTKRSSEEERHGSLIPLLFGESHFSLPYEMRSFPLPPDEYESMVKNSSHLEETDDAVKEPEPQPEKSSIPVKEKEPMTLMDVKEDYSYPATPIDASSNGSPQPEDDPNDPEWVAPLAGNI